MQSSELVELLIERFLLERCGFLATAAARLIGDDHYLGWYHSDGRLAHSVITVDPYVSGPFEGDGIDILGKRPLQQIDADIRILAPDVTCRVGEIFKEEDFEAGEEDELYLLMSILPWYATQLDLKAISPEILFRFSFTKRIASGL